MGVQSRHDISRTVEDKEAKLLLSANRKSYMPRRLTQQRMTLSDLEWPFHALCAICAVAELLVLCCIIQPTGCKIDNKWFTNVQTSMSFFLPEKPMILPMYRGREARRCPDDNSWIYSSLYTRQTASSPPPLSFYHPPNQTYLCTQSSRCPH